MKKSTAITIIAALCALLVISFVPRMVQYFAPVPEVTEETSEPTYTRVEAQKYVFTIGGDASYGLRIKVKFNSISSENVFDFKESGLIQYTFFIQSTGYIHLNAYANSSAPTYPDVYTDYVVEDYGSYKLASEITGEEESLPIVRTPFYEYVLVE